MLCFDKVTGWTDTGHSCLTALEVVFSFITETCLCLLPLKAEFVVSGCFQFLLNVNYVSFQICDPSDQNQTFETKGFCTFWMPYITRKGKVSSLKWHKLYCSTILLSKVMNAKYGWGVQIWFQEKMHLNVLYNFEVLDPLPPCSELNKI